MQTFNCSVDNPGICKDLFKYIKDPSVRHTPTPGLKNKKEVISVSKKISPSNNVIQKDILSTFTDIDVANWRQHNEDLKQKRFHRIDTGEHVSIDEYEKLTRLEKDYYHSDCDYRGWLARNCGSVMPLPFDSQLIDPLITRNFYDFNYYSGFSKKIDDFVVKEIMRAQLVSSLPDNDPLKISFLDEVNTNLEKFENKRKLMAFNFFQQQQYVPSNRPNIDDNSEPVVTPGDNTRRQYPSDEPFIIDPEPVPKVLPAPSEDKWDIFNNIPQYEPEQIVPI